MPRPVKSDDFGGAFSPLRASEHFCRTNHSLSDKNTACCFLAETKVPSRNEIDLSIDY